MASAAPEIQRQDLESAISKAVELRALHAALLHNTATSMRLQPGASPSLTRLSTQLCAEDYPVFTPSYEDEHPPSYRLCRSENRAPGRSLPEASNEEDDLLETLIRRLTAQRSSNSKSSNSKSPSFHHQQMPISEDQRSTTSSRLNHITLLHSSPASDPLRSCSRADSEDLRSIVSRSRNSLSNRNNHPSSTATATAIALPEAQQRNRPPIISWLLPRFRRKPRSDDPAESLPWGAEALRREVLLANEHRDAALAQAGEMRSAVEELRGKLQLLESYCEDLKKALKQAVRAKTSSSSAQVPARSAPAGMPVPHEAMVEGFLQMVSESRLSVRQLCKSLAGHVGDPGQDSAKVSRTVLYQLEAAVNRSLHEDFENCVFRRDGAPRELEPGRERRGNFASFVALRNLSWSEVVRKGTRCYSEEFSGFCDRKMGAVAGALGWEGSWPEELLHGFFVAAKCVWLLHLLAFAFDPPLGIVRVEEGRPFDAGYMEDVMPGAAPGRAQQQQRVKVMVMPGFYVEDRVLKCRVLCRHRNA